MHGLRAICEIKQIKRNPRIVLLYRMLFIQQKIVRIDVDSVDGLERFDGVDLSFLVILISFA